MTIGTGIAIAGVWLFAGFCAISPSITAKGWNRALIIAFVVTAILALTH